MPHRKLVRLNGLEAAGTDDDMARFIAGAPCTARVVRKKTGYRDFTTGEDVDFLVTWDTEVAANEAAPVVRFAGGRG